MKRLIQLAREALADDETCVLCTVVRLDGSGYGRPGARLLLTRSGAREGYISGGCLEKDLCRRVWSATDSGPRLLAFDTRGNSVSARHYNTGCEGIVSVLCERVTPDDTLAIDVLDASQEAASTNTRTLTIYRSKNEAFHIGQRWVEFSDRRFASDETAALPTEVETTWLASKRNQTVCFSTDNGDVEAAVEVLSPPRRVIVFGAGDDAIPLVRGAADLGWHITVVGKRPELAARNRFEPLSASGGIEVVCGDPADVARHLFIGPQTDVIVMTHDFEGDVRLLPVLLNRSTRFIGLLGPKRRLGSLVERLYASGRVLSDADTDRIRSPIGLDIGSITPGEIAVSILGELIAVERGRSGTSLHERRQPLHDPQTVCNIPTNAVAAT